MGCLKSVVVLGLLVWLPRAAGAESWSCEPVVAPDWSGVVLENPSGLDYHPAPALRERLTVLVMVRGGWCPYSVQLLKELRELEPVLAGKGFQILAVTAERPLRLRRMLEAVELPFVVVSDRGVKIAESLGMAPLLCEAEWARYREAGVELPEPRAGEPAPRLPRPGLVVLGEDGRIYGRVEGVVAEARFNPAELLRCCDLARAGSQRAGP